MKDKLIFFVFYGLENNSLLKFIHYFTLRKIKYNTDKTVFRLGYNYCKNTVYNDQINFAMINQ